MCLFFTLFHFSLWASIVPMEQYCSIQWPPPPLPQPPPDYQLIKVSQYRKVAKVLVSSIGPALIPPLCSAALIKQFSTSQLFASNSSKVHPTGLKEKKNPLKFSRILICHGNYNLSSKCICLFLLCAKSERDKSFQLYFWIYSKICCEYWWGVLEVMATKVDQECMVNYLCTYST